MERKTQRGLPFFLSGVVFALLLCSAFLPPAQAQPIDDEYIILFEPQALAAVQQESLRANPRSAPPSERALRRSIARELGAEVLDEYATLPAVHVKLDTTKIAADALRRVNRFRAIAAIEPNYRVQAMAAPNDTLYKFGLLWGMNNTGQFSGTADVDIDAPEAWNITTGNSQVVVGIIDTGILHTHPDLKANVWTNALETAGNSKDDDGNGFVDDVYGYDFFNKDGDPLDDNFHGTHVSGIIGAAGNNSRGVTGVNWSVKLMGLKILDKNGVGDTADAARAIDYAILMKQRGVNIRVLNASFGGGEESDVLRTAIQAADAAGIMFIVAAGNDGSDNDATPVYPSSYQSPNLISVAAINRKGALASFSNYGRNSVDIAAPGSNIWSTFIYNTYFFFDGTSMATPYVSGVAALLLGREPGLSPSQAKTRLMNTAKRLSGTEGKLKVPGVVSAYNAVTNTPGGTLQTTASASSAEAPNALLELAKTIFSIADSDNDGIGDQQETVDGTSLNDRGSFKFRLNSPAFTKYNTFFGQWNFLELISSGGEAVDATVTVYDISGSVLAKQQLVIPSGSQFDLNIHDMVGRSDTYGLVRIDYNDDSTAALSGRMSNYLINPDGSYSFGFARELRNATQGKTYAVANSMDPQGVGFLVPNWAEILNLEPVPHRFTYYIYNQAGTRIATDTVTVPPLGEYDIAAGHQFGQGVYLLEISPQVGLFNYLAGVTRYSSNAAPGYAAPSYAFAFSVDARAGTGELELLPITNRSGTCWRQSNWVEVTNTTKTTVNANLVLRSSAGAVVGQTRFALASRSQQHFQASALLQPGDIGSAEISADKPESLIAQSLVYFHDCQTNTLQTAYASPARIPLAGSLAGTVNTFLGMTNLLNVAQVPGNSRTSMKMFAGNQLILGDPFAVGTESAAQVNLNAYLPADTYRLLSLKPTISSRTIAENVRLREINGRVDFAMPTAVFHTK